MKQLIILAAAVSLAVTEIYSADFSRNINVPDNNSYTLLSNSNDELSDAQSYFSYTVPNPSIMEEKNSENVDVNENALQTENTPNSKVESSDETFIDGSAGAMGIGIF